MCKVCPYCGNSEYTGFIVAWEARSTEPQDRENTATLDEWQCRSVECGGRSFWLD